MTKKLIVLLATALTAFTFVVAGGAAAHWVTPGTPATERVNTPGALPLTLPGQPADQTTAPASVPVNEAGQPADDGAGQQSHHDHDRDHHDEHDDDY